jgi:hypothetical protein
MTPKTSLLLAIGAFALIVPAAASAQMTAQQENQQTTQDAAAVAKARGAYDAALKTKNKAEIKRAGAALRQAHENYTNDKQTDAAEAKASGSPDVRAAEIAVDQAHEAYQRAETSGDKAEIAKTGAALRAAHERYYSATHARKHSAG